MMKGETRVTIRKVFVLAVAALVAVAGVLAMTAQASQQATKDTLVMGVQEIGTTMDTTTYQSTMMTIFQATQEPLLHYALKTVKGSNIPVFDANAAKMVGGVVKSWTIAPDGKSITMNLRQGVKSNYGNELTTADVEWTVKRNIFYKNLGAGFAFGQAAIDPANPITVLGKYTFRFNLTLHSPLLEKILAFHWEAPFDSVEAKKHATDSDPWAATWIATHSASFGPYYLTSYQPGVSATLQANPNYYGTKPAIKRIVMRVIPDPGNRQQLLQSGSVQLVPDLPRVQLTKLKTDKRVAVNFARSSRMLFLYGNVKFKPFDNPLVRQALAYAVPYDEIMKTAYQGTGTQGHGPISPLLQFHRADLWKYTTDVAKAKALLTRAGYPNGFDVTLQFSLSNPGPENAQVAILVQAALKNVGINVKLDQATSDAAYFADMLAKKIPFGMGGTAPFVPDAGYQLGNIGTTTAPSGFSAFSLKEFDELVTGSIQTIDTKKRANLLYRAQAMWNFYVPMVPIAEPNYGIATAPNVTGWNIQPTGFPRLGLLQYTS